MILIRMSVLYQRNASEPKAMSVTSNKLGFPFYPFFHALVCSRSRHSWRGLASLTVLVFVWLHSPGVVAEVFKWVDDVGKVHYGDAPPHDRDVEAIPVPHPSPDSKALGSGLTQESLNDLQGAAEPSKVRKKKKHTVAPSKEEREKRCLEAQRQLPILELDRPIFYLNKEGNRVLMDDETRAAKVARLRDVVKTNCR